jgi:hypothetical protein
VGFLNNSTNNVILDAVLTDTGRQFLSSGRGNFSIVKFALGDDEVDYSIIQKYGRTVGKEKIEKNTPIFEALTNASLAQKFRCVSISNPNLIRMPSLSLAGEGVDSTNNVLSIGNTTVKRRTITVSQDIQNENSIDVELRDQSFVVEVGNQFLQIDGIAPDNIDGQQRATYIVTKDAGETAVGGSRVTFTLSTKAITEAQFQVYGATFNKQTIVTYIKVFGINSGSVLQFQVNIASAT